MGDDAEQPRRRVREARVARLATVSAAGHPHLVPCTFVLVGDLVYTAVDAKPKSTMSLRRLENIRANPQVALLVDRYDEDWSSLWWVRLDGAAQVFENGPERERALSLLADKYHQYRETAPPGPVIAMTVERWRSWG